MKRINPFILILGLVAFIWSCNINEPVLFDGSKSYVAFTKASINVPEAGDSVEVSIMLAALKGSPAATITFAVDTIGCARPAIIGEDFTISPASTIQVPDGYGVVKLLVTPIDNDVFTGDKTFNIRITENSEGYDLGSAGKVVIVLKDNEHPLAKWIGSYTVAAASYGSPGAWDESWSVTTAPDPADLNNLVVTGIGAASGLPIVGKVDIVAGTITFAGGQDVGNVYGYGPIGVFLGNEEGNDVIDGVPLVGTVEDDGSILVDHWGHKITSGVNEGYVWDVFNTTWTKQ